MIVIVAESRQQIKKYKVGRCKFEIFNEFKYLGVSVNQLNNEEVEIQSRINSRNRSLYALNKTKLLSHITKLRSIKSSLNLFYHVVEKNRF